MGFFSDLDRGYQRRHQWQAKISEIANKLDRHEHAPEVAALLRELFEAIGERG